MFLIDRLIFFGSLLILVAIFSRKVSARFGVPVLVLFLFIGMMAGSEGVGGIDFEDYRIAHGLGILALAVIMFDGGLRTGVRQLRLSWKPASVLATVGVLATAVVTGVAASWIIGITLLEGLLLASIVASTDAAAVFSILRSQGVNLDERLSATLEVESGSNDPMAVLLTVGLIEVMLGERSPGAGLLTFFLLQMGVGLLVGYVLGRLAVYLIDRINLDAAGLYPVLVLTLGLLTYGLAANLNGSGFLAVYVAGIVIGNSPLVYQRGTLLFHDGVAWISQISMFVVLGLLSFPSRLIDVAWQGIAVGVVLMFVARPLVVVLSLLPFRYSAREVAFISWVGLKGAVPIILATYPLLFGVPDGLIYFNVVFFVVLVSALAQGWSLPAVARRLGLELPARSVPPVTLDITSLRHVSADIVDYEITERSAAAHLRISELVLPEDVVIAMVSRGNDIIPARGPTVLLPGDHVFIILRPAVRAAVDAVFQATTEHELPLRAGVYLPGTLTLRQLDDLYDIRLAGDPDQSIARFMEQRLRRPLKEGAFLEVAEARLYVHSAAPGTGVVIGVEDKR